jgi:hypothetical protein
MGPRPQAPGASSDVTAGKSFGDEMRLVARVELVAQILHVPFDGARGDSELLRALLGREAARDALKHFAFAFREGDEILLLSRKIHHQLRTWIFTKLFPPSYARLCPHYRRLPALCQIRTGAIPSTMNRPGIIPTPLIAGAFPKSRSLGFLPDSRDKLGTSWVILRSKNICASSYVFGRRDG